MKSCEERRVDMLGRLDALSEVEARKLLRAVALCMWPNGGHDADAEWSADTTDALAGVFHLFGVNPDAF